jgi:hypothetical protein
MSELRLLLGIAGLEKWLHYVTGRFGRHVVMGVVGFAFAMALASVTTALVAAAIYWALLPSLGAVESASLTAAVFLIILVILGIIAIRQLRAPPQSPLPALLPTGVEPETAALAAPQNLRDLLTLVALGVILGLTRRDRRRG